MGTFSTRLLARLIYVGLHDTQFPRLVDITGQTGCNAAFSHCCGPRRSSEMQLTVSNMGRLQRSIKPSEIPRCVFDAMDLTSSLGMRYLWIDSLCLVRGDREGLSRMSGVCRSAIVTIVATEAMSPNDEVIDSCINSAVLEQPFSIFLDWSRPTVAKSFSDPLFAPNTFS